MTDDHIIIEEYDAYYHLNAYKDDAALPVITQEEPHRVKPLRWGLVPGYAKDIKDAQVWSHKMLNATCEKMSTTYSQFYQSKRCLILVDGFYEWRWEDLAGKTKTPYFIYKPDHEVFTFGGIYNTWHDRASDLYLNTCSIITTPANERMEFIHNNKKRMPLIIDKDDWGTWLNSPEDATTLIRPYKNGELQDHVITKLITKKGADTNVPDVQLPEVTLF